MTLVQVMVSMSLATVVMFSVMQIIELSQKGQKGLIQSDDFQTLFYNVRTIMSNGLGCTMNLKGVEYDKEESTRISVHFPNSEAKKGELLIQEGTKKFGLEFTQVQIEPIGELSLAHQIAKVKIRAEKIKQNGQVTTFGGSIFEREFTLHMTLDAEKKIESCWGETTAQATCVEIGGVYNANATDPTKRCDMTAKICGAFGFVIGPDGNCEMTSAQMAEAQKGLNELMGEGSALQQMIEMFGGGATKPATAGGRKTPPAMPMAPNYQFN